MLIFQLFVFHSLLRIAQSKNVDLEEIRQSSILISNASTQNVPMKGVSKKGAKKKKKTKYTKVTSSDPLRGRNKAQSSSNEPSKCFLCDFSFMNVFFHSFTLFLVVISTNSRSCPILGCKKSFNSAPSIKYHICTQHPSESIRFKLVSKSKICLTFINFY